jgi:hypothetical protein
MHHRPLRRLHRRRALQASLSPCPLQSKSLLLFCLHLPPPPPFPLLSPPVALRARAPCSSRSRAHRLPTRRRQSWRRVWEPASATLERMLHAPSPVPDRVSPAHCSACPPRYSLLTLRQISRLLEAPCRLRPGGILALAVHRQPRCHRHSALFCGHVCVSSALSPISRRIIWHTSISFLHPSKPHHASCHV